MMLPNDFEIFWPSLVYNGFTKVGVVKTTISTKKKRYFDVLNILYTSNKLFLKNNWNSINKEIFRTYKVFFCAQYFLKKEDCVFPKSTNFSMNFKKTICVKNLPANFKFDTIYSEIIY